MNIEEAWTHVANSIYESDSISDSAEVSIRADPILGEAAAFHCRWLLEEKRILFGEGSYSGKCSREVTGQITSGAMKKFCAASPRARSNVNEMRADF